MCQFYCFSFSLLVSTYKILDVLVNYCLVELTLVRKKIYYDHSKGSILSIKKQNKHLKLEIVMKKMLQMSLHCAMFSTGGGHRITESPFFRLENSMSFYQSFLQKGESWSKPFSSEITIHLLHQFTPYSEIRYIVYFFSSVLLVLIILIYRLIDFKWNWF